MAKTCPSGPQWDAAVKEFGIFRASKFYLNNGEQMADLDTVRTYLEAENSLPIRYSVTDPKEVDSTYRKMYQETEPIKHLFHGLNEFFQAKFPQVESQYVMEAEWNAAIKDGKVTINIEHAQLSDMFHEYSHPLLMSMRISNKELFDNLWNDLQKTPEWNLIRDRVVDKVKRLYRWGDDLKGDAFIEEALAQAIGYAAEAKMLNQAKDTSKSLRDLVDKILAWFSNIITSVFGVEITVSELSPTTTLGEIVDKLTDFRTSFLLDENWIKADELANELEEKAGLSSQAQIDGTDAGVAELQASLKVNPDINEVIETWIEKNFKLPVRDYVPRKGSRDDHIKKVAEMYLDAVNTGFRLTGDELSNPTDNNLKRLGQALIPIEFQYKFADYLIDKPDRVMPLNQPFAIIKEKIVTDKQGIERKQTNINIPVTEQEALVTERFRRHLQKLYPGVKSMKAQQLYDEYMQWVTRHYGISTIPAHGFGGFGVGGVVKGTSMTKNYHRVMLIDDFLMNFKHTMPLGNTGVNGNGLGWYVRLEVGKDRADFEFQSDLIPEVYKSFKQEEYKEEVTLESYKPEEAESKASSQALKKLMSMMEFRSDIPLAGILNFQPFVMGTHTIDIENMSETALQAIMDLINTEYDVTIRRYEGSTVHTDIKFGVSMLRALLRKESPKQKEFLDWIKTFEWSDRKDTRSMLGEEFEETLPFSKRDTEKDRNFINKVLHSRNISKGPNVAPETRVLRATQKTLETIPIALQKIYDNQVQWYYSEAPIKPPQPSMYEVIANLAHIVGLVLNPVTNELNSLWGNNRSQLRNMLERDEKYADKEFKKYRMNMGKLKGAKFKKQMYQDPKNVMLALNYYKTQYERIYKFFISIAEEGYQLAQENEKIGEPLHERYYRYRDLYKNWFDIIVVQSINSAKREGRTHYYLPTAAAMKSFEGNAMSETIYRTPKEAGDTKSIGPFFTALNKFAKKNNIRLSYETPNWSNVELIKVDLTNYTLKNPLRFSKRDNDALSKRKSEQWNKLTDHSDKRTFEKVFITQEQVNAFVRNYPDLYATPLVEYTKGYWKTDVTNPHYEQDPAYYIDLKTDEEHDRANSMAEFIHPVDQSKPNVQNMNNAVASSAVSKMMEIISNQLGIQYNLITEEEAARITSATNDPYIPGSGQRAFFFKNMVYFVGPNITTEMVFHEFAHPMIRAIEKTNPGLFEKLFDDLVNTKEGQEIIKMIQEKYTNLVDLNSPGFREEAIVWGLTQRALAMDDKREESTGFKKAIDNILYHIKKMFRALFGQSVNISKLNANTSLNDLAKMLVEGDKFDIETEVITDDDMIAYMRDQKQAIDDVVNIDPVQITSFITRGYDIVLKQTEVILKNRNFTAMRKLLVDEFNRGDLFDIRQQFGKFTARHAEVIDKFKNEIEENKERAESFVATLLRIGQVIDKIYGHLKTLTDNLDNKDNLMKVYHYNYLVKYWGNYFDEISDYINDEGLDSKSPFVGLINDLQRKVEQTATETNKINKLGLVDILAEVLLPMSQIMEQKYKENIANRKKRGHSKKIVDVEYIEFYGMTEDEWTDYQKLSKNTDRSPSENSRFSELRRKSFNGARITKEKIQMSLEGKLDDANFANSFFEGYMYNTDPIVGGFATYVKNNMTDVLNKSYTKYNDFMKEVSPILEEIGINFKNTTELSELITFVDEVGTYDHDTHELNPTKVLTLLNPFIGHRLAVDRLNQAIDKAQAEYVSKGTEELKLKLQQARLELSNLRKDFFHQEYVKEYYSRDEILVHNKNDKIGLAAKEARDEILGRIKSQNLALSNDPGNIILESQLDALWAEYRQLHSKYDELGNIKTNSTKAPDGEVIMTYDLSIAERLSEYRDKTSHFHERVLRKGLFERSLREFEQKLVSENKLNPEDEEYTIQRDRWIKRNTKIVLTQAYFDRKREITDKITEIMKNASGRISNEDWTLYKELRTKKRENRATDDELARLDVLISTYGAELGYKTLVDKKYDIIKAHKNSAGDIEASSMSKEELDNFKKLELDIIKAKKRMGKAKGIGKSGWKLLNKAWNELDELDRKYATEDYVQTIKKILGNKHGAILDSQLGSGEEITQENADYLLEDPVVEELKAADEEFAEWFDRNHIRITRKIDKRDESYWERTSIWNVVRPRNEKYYEHTEVTKEDGTTEMIKGVPANKYYISIVKREYRTEKIIGETVDNRDRWLPRKDVADSPFLNKKYFELEKAAKHNKSSKEAKVFKLLKAMTKHHLDNQQGLGHKSKLYLDVPRYRMKSLEALQMHSKMKNIKGTGRKNFPYFSLMIDAIQRVYKRAKDDPERGFNPEDEFRLISTDMFDNELSNIYIGGMFDMDIEFVSRDVIHSMMKYMLSAERQKKLVEINPVATALKDFVNKVNPPKTTSSGAKLVNKFNLRNRNILSFVPKRKKSVRATAINNLIEREFENKHNVGWLSDNKLANNFASLMFKRAAFGYFALNIPSAIKNMIGPKWQGMIETSAKQHMNLSSLAKGEGYAFQAMGEISFQIYKSMPKSLTVQLVDIFDAIQGRTEDKFGESISRTIAHDVANLSWLYNFRKWTESEATLHLFFGMMIHQKVKQGDKEIDYVKAWESVDGQIRLKKGIDVRYGHLPVDHRISKDDKYEDVANSYNIPITDFEDIITRKRFEMIQRGIEKLESDRDKDLAKQTNEQIITRINQKYDREISDLRLFRIDNSLFKLIRNRIHQASNNLQGAYSSFDQPEAQRYLAFRFFSFLRRFFIPMFTKRFGYSGRFFDPKGRFNPGLADNPMGYYMTALRTVMRTLRVDKTYLLNMSHEEQRAWYRMALEVSLLLITTILINTLFGYDPDDPDRYAKLRRKTDALPFFGLTADDPTRDFDLGGFFSNHMLSMLMMVREENEFLVPWPGFGMSDYVGMLNLNSLMVGPTFRSYNNMLMQLYTGAEYKREVGPYLWQQQGGSKFLTTFMKMLGFTGTSLEPELMVKVKESMRKSSAKIR